MGDKKKIKDWLKEHDYFLLDELDLDKEVTMGFINELVKEKKIIKMKYGF